jgi:hypothetical protein
MSEEYTLWRNGTQGPWYVDSLAAHCKEYGLDYQAMKNVVQGKIKGHRGWSINTRLTSERDARAKELEALLDESESKYGVAFVLE